MGEFPEGLLGPWRVAIEKTGIGRERLIRPLANMPILHRRLSHQVRKKCVPGSKPSCVTGSVTPKSALKHGFFDVLDEGLASQRDRTNRFHIDAQLMPKLDRQIDIANPVVLIHDAAS